MRQKCDILPYSVDQWIGNWILPQFDPKISSLGLIEAKIIPKLRTTGNYCNFCGGGGGLVFSGGALVVGGGSICGDLGVLTLVMDFREVILTSPPELAHCAPPPLFRKLWNPRGTFDFWSPKRGKKRNFPKNPKMAIFLINFNEKCPIVSIALY